MTNKDDFKKREIREGLRVEVNCIAVGNPQTTYYVWRWENGSVIQNKTSGKLLFPSIKPNEGGRLSCAGHSPLGEGEKQYIDLFVQGRIILENRLFVSACAVDILLSFMLS